MATRVVGNRYNVALECGLAVQGTLPGHETFDRSARGRDLMDNDLYRVVLTGELVSGYSREAVIASLSRMFEVSAGTLIGVFDGKPYPVDERLSAEDAAALQRRLEEIGAHARVERVGPRPMPADSLHLPHHSEIPAGLMRCPACGHKQLVARSCDECGVVFAEYNRKRAADQAPRVIREATPVRRRPAAAAPRADDIHARKENGWHDAWVDDGDELPTEQYHVGLFMGHSSAPLAEICQRMMLGRRTQLRLSWAGGAVISPFLWAMYRKMWAWGMLIFVTEILLPVLLIALGSKPFVSDKLTYLGIAGIVANRVFWPAVLKYLYCRHTRNMIAYMNRMSPTYAADIDIATAGGTSKTSVFVGIVLAIVVSLLTWNVVDTVYSQIVSSQAVFTEPETAPGATWQPNSNRGGEQAPRQADVDKLTTENKWVATRNRLRVLGQRLTTWFSASAGSVDPARLSIADIGQALLLDLNSTVDGWGKQFRYRYNDGGFQLYSAGPDGQFDTDDDIKYRRSLKR